jgi:hypothetical protein
LIVMVPPNCALAGCAVNANASRPKNSNPITRHEIAPLSFLAFLSVIVAWSAVKAFGTDFHVPASRSRQNLLSLVGLVGHGFPRRFLGRALGNQGRKYCPTSPTRIQKKTNQGNMRDSGCLCFGRNIGKTIAARTSVVPRVF